MWIDTHCHLDAAEFAPDRDGVRARAHAVGVGRLVIPAVARGQWRGVIELAGRHGDGYALGIHPLYTPRASEDDIAALRELLAERLGDPRLVAVGEIGLDFFVPGLDARRQVWFYEQQVRLAREFGLPVILHVRKSSDRLLKTLRAIEVPGGIAHAFNGSAQQAQAFIGLGFALGFGGAVTYERALRLRELAATLPLASIVMETDAPDIPPHWLYVTAGQRSAGTAQGRNTPAELPRIAAHVAELRGMEAAQLAGATTANACRVLPRLAQLV